MRRSSSSWSRSRELWTHGSSSSRTSSKRRPGTARCSRILLAKEGGKTLQGFDICCDSVFKGSRSASSSSSWRTSWRRFTTEPTTWTMWTRSESSPLTKTETPPSILSFNSFWHPREDCWRLCPALKPPPLQWLVVHKQTWGRWPGLSTVISWFVGLPRGSPSNFVCFKP